MNTFFQFLAAVVRTLLHLVLWLAAALFALFFLALALLALGWLVLKALFTGRRPVFAGALHSSLLHRAGRVRSWRAGAGGLRGAGRGSDAAQDVADVVDVVDVQAHEVRPGGAQGASSPSTTPTAALESPRTTD